MTRFWQNTNDNNNINSNSNNNKNYINHSHNKNKNNNLNNNNFYGLWNNLTQSSFLIFKAGTHFLLKVTSIGMFQIQTQFCTTWESQKKMKTILDISFQDT